MPPTRPTVCLRCSSSIWSSREFAAFSSPIPRTAKCFHLSFIGLSCSHRFIPDVLCFSHSHELDQVVPPSGWETGILRIPPPRAALPLAWGIIKSHKHLVANGLDPLSFREATPTHLLVLLDSTLFRDKIENVLSVPSILSQKDCIYLSISSSMKSLAPRSTIVQEAWVLVPLKKINSPSPTRCSETYKIKPQRRVVMQATEKNQGRALLKTKYK